MRALSGAAVASTKKPTASSSVRFAEAALEKKGEDDEAQDNGFLFASHLSHLLSHHVILLSLRFLYNKEK
jgi:hypothetical protein